MAIIISESLLSRATATTYSPSINACYGPYLITSGDISTGIVDNITSLFTTSSNIPTGITVGVRTTTDGAIVEYWNPTSTTTFVAKIPEITTAKTIKKLIDDSVAFYSTNADLNDYITNNDIPALNVGDTLCLYKGSLSAITASRVYLKLTNSNTAGSTDTWAVIGTLLGTEENSSATVTSATVISYK